MLALRGYGSDSDSDKEGKNEEAESLPLHLQPRANANSVALTVAVCAAPPVLPQVPTHSSLFSGYFSCIRLIFGRSVLG